MQEAAEELNSPLPMFSTVRFGTIGWPGASLGNLFLNGVRHAAALYRRPAKYSLLHYHNKSTAFPGRIFAAERTYASHHHSGIGDTGCIATCWDPYHARKIYEAVLRSCSSVSSLCPQGKK